jgi:hypothetical protein
MAAREVVEKHLRKESETVLWKASPASPAKRIDPRTGEVVEIISTPRLPLK